MYDGSSSAIYNTGNSMKNQHDKRFRCTVVRINRAIDEMVANDDIKTQVRDFSKYVGIYASTFYRHYASIPEAIASRDQAIYDDLKECVSSKNLRVIFYRLFTYLGDNKLYFRNAEHHLNLEMLKIFAMENLRPIVLTYWFHSKGEPITGANSQFIMRIYRIYCFELLHEYYEWVFVITAENSTRHSPKAAYNDIFVSILYFCEIRERDSVMEASISLREMLSSSVSSFL